MKITLAVLFLAGLTIYCKCTAVLSLPPSLIAHAASLEERHKAQKPTTSTIRDNGLSGVKGGGEGGGGGEAGGEGGVVVEEQNQEEESEDVEENEDANNVAADLYRNLKNLWQKDLSLNLQKRERYTFEDDIANVATPQQQQQQQPPTTIKNNNKIALEQQQQHHVNNNNNILKTTSSAAATSTTNDATNLNIDPQHEQQQQLVSEEYDSNEWFPPGNAEITNDDISVSPSFPTLLPVGQTETTNLESFNSGAQSQIHDFSSPVDDVADAVVWNKYLKPLKYWTKQCHSEIECPQEYYRALIADRSNALLKQLQYKQNSMQSPPPPSTPAAFNPLTDFSTLYSTPSMSSGYNNVKNDDIILLLTAEQNLIQFLSWALAELYPFGKFTNQSVDGADSYHPGMYMWKKLNLSGRLEPPLLVEEPHYVIVRREYGNNDDDDFKKGLNYGGDPFIPPRGRKHNLPDLDSLLHRYETFVPNRGRRDNIKDMFKYDDLFYPNRGKRQMTMAPIDIGVGDERNDNGGEDDVEDIDDENQENQLYNDENVEQQFQQYPLSSANEMTTIKHIKNLMAKMKRKLHRNQQQQQQQQEQQKIADIFDEMSRNEPTTRMSTTFQQLPTLSSSSPSSPSPSLLDKRFKSLFNILHKQQRRQQQQQQSHPRRQWLKRYSTTAAATNNDRPASVPARSMATNRLQTLRSMSPLQQLTQLYQQQQQQHQQQHQQQNQHLQQHHHHLHQQQHQQPDYISSPSSAPLWQQATKFMFQPRQQLLSQQQQQQLQQQQQPLKSLAQQFDPLSWHKLQMLQHQYQQHLPLLTMRHPRLTALQHLPPIQQRQQQQQPHHQQQQQQHQQMQRQQHLQQATPQETQLTYSSDHQIDNSITNDHQNFFNKDLD